MKFLLTCFVSLALFMLVTPVYAATITVDSTSDLYATDGECTLRESIDNANTDVDGTGGDCVAGSGTDTIEFNIAGAGPHTIILGLTLPTITAPTILDGETQPGASCDPRTLMITLDGDNVVAGDILRLAPGSTGSTIRGLNFFGSTGDGLQIDSDDNTIVCNHIGTNIGATAVAGNINVWNGILIEGANGNQIGGITAADRNIISGNGNNGIFIDSGDDTVIQGNYIGTNITGLTSIPNVAGGIETLILPGNIEDGTIIGGSVAGARNVISGNAQEGIALYTTTNTSILGNYIGVGSDGTTDLGNSTVGINIPDSTLVNIGNATVGGRNVISGNTNQGMYVGADSSRIGIYTE